MVPNIAKVVPILVATDIQPLCFFVSGTALALRYSHIFRVDLQKAQGDWGVPPKPPKCYPICTVCFKDVGKPKRWPLPYPKDNHWQLQYVSPAWPPPCRSFS